MQTNAQRLETWFGAEQVERISLAMKHWYGPPIPLGCVKGSVFAQGGGDFAGRIEGGQFASMLDWFEQRLRRHRRAFRTWARWQRGTLNTGFASVTDYQNALKYDGGRRDFPFNKQGAAALSVGDSVSNWYVGNQPPAGAVGAAAPGGTIPTDATTGAHFFVNPPSGDQQHYVEGYATSQRIDQCLLVYDRLFSVAKTMSSTATEAVTGVPTRYQNTTTTADDYIAGNFLHIASTTTLGATAHNWTVCTYLDQANAASTFPSMAGVASCPAGQLDHPAASGIWFMPLAAGDVGVKALTQMQCSASVTGAIDFVIGHPLGIIPAPHVNWFFKVDGINSSINLARIFDDACLTTLVLPKGNTGSTDMRGHFTTVSG